MLVVPRISINSVGTLTSTNVRGLLKGTEMARSCHPSKAWQLVVQRRTTDPRINGLEDNGSDNDFLISTTQWPMVIKFKEFQQREFSHWSSMKF